MLVQWTHRSRIQITPSSKTSAKCMLRACNVVHTFSRLVNAQFINSAYLNYRSPSCSTLCIFRLYVTLFRNYSNSSLVLLFVRLWSIVLYWWIDDSLSTVFFNFLLEVNFSANWNTHYVNIHDMHSEDMNQLIIVIDPR